MDQLYQKILLIILALAHTGIDVCRSSTVSVRLKPVTTRVGEKFTITCRIKPSTGLEGIVVNRTVMEGNIIEHTIYKSIPEYWNEKNFDKTKYDLNDGGKLNINITVKNVTFQDAGKYTCEPIVFDHDSSTADVLVLGKTVVTLPDIVAGEPFQATCEVQFRAPSTITEGNSHFPQLIGKVDDTEFNGTTQLTNATVETDFKSVLEKTMNITLSESSNGHNFWCIARTIKPNHEETSSEVLYFQFNVTQPELLKSSTVLPETPGEYINCSAQGNPRPTIKWKPVKSKINATFDDILPLLKTMAGEPDEKWICEASNEIKGVPVVKKKEHTFRIEPLESPYVTPGWVVGLSVGIPLVAVFVLIGLVRECQIRKKYCFEN